MPGPPIRVGGPPIGPPAVQAAVFGPAPISIGGLVVGPFFEAGLRGLKAVLNQLAHTSNLGEIAAANVYAGTTNLGLLAALNVKAGTSHLGLVQVCNKLAGTTNEGIISALNILAGN